MSNGCQEGYHWENGRCVPDGTGLIERLSAQITYEAINRAVRNSSLEEVQDRVIETIEILKETLEKLTDGGHYPEAGAKR